jgi:N-acetyltransferase
MEWGKEEQKEFEKHNVAEIDSAIKLKSGAQGRIICFNANVGGKIGAKVRSFVHSQPIYLTST